MRVHLKHIIMMNTRPLNELIPQQQSSNVFRVHPACMYFIILNVFFLNEVDPACLCFIEAQ